MGGNGHSITNKEIMIITGSIVFVIGIMYAGFIGLPGHFSPTRYSIDQFFIPIVIIVVGIIIAFIGMRSKN